MKTIFLKDDRLREIITDRNKKIMKLLLSGELKGTISFKILLKDGHLGWEIIDNENGYSIKERFGPTGTITALKDYFKPVDDKKS